MLRYIFRRVLFLIPVLVGVAFCVFLLLYLTPGDPAKMVLGDLATEQAIQEFREKEGLNDPFWIRFGKYLYKAVVKGDMTLVSIEISPIVVNDDVEMLQDLIVAAVNDAMREMNETAQAHIDAATGGMNLPLR